MLHADDLRGRDRPRDEPGRDEGDIGREGTIPVDRAGAVTVPALVLTGGADHPWMTDVGRRLAEVLPQGRHRVMEGQEHVVPPEVLVPVLTRFLAD